MEKDDVSPQTLCPLKILRELQTEDKSCRHNENTVEDNFIQVKEKR
jgi:hypothetical protein